MRLKWLTVFCGFVLLLITPSLVRADESFSTALKTTYTVTLDGSTHVKFDFTITNLKPTVYVKQYAVRLQQSGLTNITAANQGLAIIPSVSDQDNQTNIALNFPDEIVGEGKQRSFQIEFDTPQLAIITGKVLEVRIPEVNDDSTYQTRQVTLVTPSEFGKAYRITPQPDSTTQIGKQIVSTFSSLNQRGVVAIFGQEQIFRLNLRYYLDNPTGSPISAQIALPPTTSYQQLNYQTLEPRPKRVREDEDGNWLAEYLLKPNEEIIVNTVALARVTLDSNPEVPIIKPIDQHLTEQMYWPVQSPTIEDLVTQNQNIGQIYQTVIETLTYTDDELTGPRERLGAMGALENPTAAVCQEYSDLFVTLSRNRGIPARRIAGYAVAEDRSLRPLSLVGDILHSWADYFDAPSGQWRQVDPTWEDTTGGVDYFSQFDLNHITFVINGVSSTLPYPAGFYKQGDSPTQNVVVELADKFTRAEPDISLEVINNKLMGSPIPGWHTLVITNHSGEAWYQVNGQIRLTNQNLSSVDISPSDIRWRSLLPFESKQVPIFVTTPGLGIQATPLQLSLQLGNHEKKFEFAIRPISTAPSIFSGWQDFATTMGVAGLFVILTLTSGSVLVLRRKKQSALCRQSQKLESAGQVISTINQTAPTTAPDDSPGAKS